MKLALILYGQCVLNFLNLFAGRTTIDLTEEKRGGTWIP
jgi:bisphosphoglycerate-dependent phosphoglycerate mutase